MNTGTYFHRLFIRDKGSVGCASMANYKIVKKNQTAPDLSITILKISGAGKTRVNAGDYIEL